MTSLRRGKLVDDSAEALAGLRDGMTVAVSGFGLSSNPEWLIDAVLALGVRDLWLVSNNAGAMGRGLAQWLRAGIVSRVTCSYVGSNADLQAAIDGGVVAVEMIPQGTLTERLRAAGAGLAAFYTPTGVGTVVADGKEVREFDGRTYLLERALPVDFALIRASKADWFGKLRFHGTQANFGPVMAMAARVAVAEAEQIVEIGALDPADVHVPGAFIQRVLHAAHHVDWIEQRTVRPS